MLSQYLKSDAPELARLYAAINFSVDHELDKIVAELKDSEVRMKTFSYMGRKDVSTGDDLRAFLTKTGIEFRSPQPRTVVINYDDFQKLFGEDNKE
jgi:hypothetical protein